MLGPPIDRGGVEEIGEVARPRPDLSDVKVTGDVLQEKALRDGVVVGSVSGFQLDAWVEDRDEAPPFAVKRVDKGPDGPFGVVDRVEGEVLPPFGFFDGFFFFRGMEKKK